MADEVTGWCHAGLNAVVCLRESSEIRDLQLKDEPILCKNSNIEFISFPISNRGVPSSVRQTAQLVEKVVGVLRAAATVAIHCRAGSRRAA